MLYAFCLSDEKPQLSITPRKNHMQLWLASLGKLRVLLMVNFGGFAYITMSAGKLLVLSNAKGSTLSRLCQNHRVEDSFFFTGAQSAQIYDYSFRKINQQLFREVYSTIHSKVIL